MDFEGKFIKVLFCSLLIWGRLLFKNGRVTITCNLIDFA